MALTLSAAVGACGGADGAPPAPPVERRVVLGTGEKVFETIEGEPTLDLVAGVQGGFHVWASFRAYGFPEPRIDMVLTTSLEDRPDSRLVMRAQLTPIQGEDENGDRFYSFAGFPAQVYNARCAQGRRVHIEIALSDEAGGLAEDSRSCIAELDPMYRSQSCE